MNYAQIRSQIKTGDILAWSHGSWKSLHDIQVLAVRAFTLSEYSHVGLAWVVNGRVFVIHSIGAGVSLNLLSTQGDFYWVPMDAEFTDEALETMFTKLGEKYSKLEAVLGFLRKLKIGADSKWQCAEFAIWAYKLINRRISDVATPSAIVKELLNQGHELRFVEAST